MCLLAKCKHIVVRIDLYWYTIMRNICAFFNAFGRIMILFSHGTTCINMKISWFNSLYVSPVHNIF